MSSRSSDLNLLSVTCHDSKYSVATESVCTAARNVCECSYKNPT